MAFGAFHFGPLPSSEPCPNSCDSVGPGCHPSIEDPVSFLRRCSTSVRSLSQIPAVEKSFTGLVAQCVRYRGLAMSKWQDEKEKRNRQSIARLTSALPSIFPSNVLARALNRPFVPPTPRLAIDSYWRAHPIRADRLARSLAARSGAPHGWTWRLGNHRKSGLPTTFRIPPAPYRERGYTKGAGFCCVCGQPVYRFGWHIDLWDTGTNKNASWHCACALAWQFWNAPSSEARLLRRLQARRCSQSDERLWRTAEVDHRMPLFRVWSEHRNTAWPKLLAYWGLPNLQVINRDAHAAKCAEEARERRAVHRQFVRSVRGAESE
jgi:hypothetical protein